jgi:peptidoglycan/LPS O-acetylase OafA/YrhL
MGDGVGFVDLLFLGGAVALMVLTSVRVRRHGRMRKAPEGQRAAAIGIMVWLGLLGFALYLIFG